MLSHFSPIVSHLPDRMTFSFLMAIPELDPHLCWNYMRGNHKAKGFSSRWFEIYRSQMHELQIVVTEPAQARFFYSVTASFREANINELLEMI